jgi:hypothetical protein
VVAVVRLNEPQYDVSAFRAAGIAVADLFFEDCSPPPVDVVAKFLLLAERIPGAIAVHCKAGLGRTGTLIALHMMQRHGFSAREAMGWLRIVRPGSVIGEQQQFLCDREPLMRREAARQRAPDADAAAAAAAVPHSAAGLAAVERVVRSATADIDGRLARAARAGAFERLSTGGGGGDAVLSAHVAAAAARRSGMRAAEMGGGEREGAGRSKE